jgi:renalase
MPPRRVAVVGAGIAGLACARTLADRGWTVRIFESEACPGGRLATRRLDTMTFDHGVRYLTVQDPRFDPVIRRLQADGIVESWLGRAVTMSGHGPGDEVDTEARFVGVPTMEAMAIHLSRGLDIRLSCTVAAVRRQSGRWRLFDAGGGELDDAGFDALVLAAPSDLSCGLLDGHSDLGGRLAAVRWDPCWSVMLGLARRSGIEFDEAFVSDDPILAWAARESSKPMRVARRGAVETWVLQARPDWSRAYLEIPESEAARWLQRAFAARLGKALVQCTVAAHRWRRARPVNPLDERFLFDANGAVGIAGDGCGGPRVEDAYLSGVALAEAITS